MYSLAEHAKESGDIYLISVWNQHSQCFGINSRNPKHVVSRFSQELLLICRTWLSMLGPDLSDAATSYKHWATSGGQSSGSKLVSCGKIDGHVP